MSGGIAYEDVMQIMKVTETRVSRGCRGLRRRVATDTPSIRPIVLSRTFGYVRPCHVSSSDE